MEIELRFIPVCELKKLFLSSVPVKCHNCIYYVLVDEVLAEQYSLMGYRWMATGNSISRGRLRFERGNRHSLGCNNNLHVKYNLRFIRNDRKLVCRCS